MTNEGKDACRAVTNGTGNAWAIVLAAGEGSRLRSLTKDDAGRSVPKQFCSLRAGRSLLHEALHRAALAASPDRVCAIVAAEHERWWSRSLECLPAGNVIVQPRNRGTAHGMLLALVHVLERDPFARVVFLPADHYVADEPVLAAAVRHAEHSVRQNRVDIVLLGIAPDKLDPDLGYIVPERGAGPVIGVRRFVEKPSLHEACSLVAEGALWNAFIVSAQARALLGIFLEHDSTVVVRMRAAVREGDTRRGALERLYLELPNLDFSRDIAELRADGLSVLRVPACGWSDLGTPERVARTLDLTSLRGTPAERSESSGVLSLEQRLAALADTGSALEPAHMYV